MHVRLEKAIPTEAGLGGGSADAAATLAGLNVLWEARRSRRDLARLGAELGADVPFFLHGGTALGSGRGDELYPVDDVGRLGIVVIKPSFGVCDRRRRTGGWTRIAPRTSPVPAGLSAGNRSRVADRADSARERPGGASGPAPPHDYARWWMPCRREGAPGRRDDGQRIGGVRAVCRGPGQARRPAQLQRPDWLICLSRTLARREAARASWRVIDFRVRDGHVRPD